MSFDNYFAIGLLLGFLFNLAILHPPPFPNWEQWSVTLPLHPPPPPLPPPTFPIWTSALCQSQQQKQTVKKKEKKLKRRRKKYWLAFRTPHGPLWSISSARAALSALSLSCYVSRPLSVSPSTSLGFFVPKVSDIIVLWGAKSKAGGMGSRHWCLRGGGSWEWDTKE